MFEKNMHFAYLLDLYGEVLDEHAKDVMRAYYEDDLSLSEIAEGESISRQGVRHIIKKSEEELIFMDSKLKFRDFYEKLEALSADQISEAERLDSLPLPKQSLEKIRLIASEMLKRD